MRGFARLDPGTPLAEPVARRMSSALRHDVSRVRIHTGPHADALAQSRDARAVAWGSHIAFAHGEHRPGTPIGDAVLAHELAHTIQQREHADEAEELDPRELGGTRDSVLEADADSAARAATSSDSASSHAPQAHAGLSLAGCSRKDAVLEALQGRRAWTRSIAEDAINHYRSKSSAERDDLIRTYESSGELGHMLDNLPPGSTQKGGAYENEVRDLLERIQRLTSRAHAATLGLSNDSAMAQAQTTEMTARNTAAAQAANPMGPPPSTAQVAAQQTTQVAQTSIAPQVASMNAATASAINVTLLTVSIPNFIIWANGAHPELGINMGHFRADALAVFGRGTDVLAFNDGGAARAVVGQTFRDAVALNPAYVMPTVMHEIWGHSTYDHPGQTSYSMQLYDQAAAGMAGYTQPAGGSQARQSELDAYDYQETEIYSLMRGVGYLTPSAPAHQVAMTDINYDPADWIRGRIAIIKAQWEARVSRAILRGMYRRFLADPTIRVDALNAFRAGVRANYPVAEANLILQ